MTLNSLATAAAAIVLGGSMMTGAEARADDPITLTGCLVRAERGEGYLVINAPREPAATSRDGDRATPGTVGTTGVFANIFYWLDDDKELAPHIGHQVQVEGDLKGQLKDGEIKIDRKDAWTELEVKADGREMKARVPNASVVAGPNPDRKMDVLVRRVDVDKVKMLDATCR